MYKTNVNESYIDIVKILCILSKDVPYEIFNYVVLSGPVTVEQIAKHVKLNSDTIKCKLDVLIKNQLVLRSFNQYMISARGKMIYDKITEFIQKNDSLYNQWFDNFHLLSSLVSCQHHLWAGSVKNWTWS